MPYFSEHPDRHQRGAGDEQHRLDDLDVGGALHAADQHVGDHQHADGRDHEALAAAVVDVHQQRDQTAGAGHLREQVEERTRPAWRSRRRCGPGRSRIRNDEHVGHREAAGVAQQLGDEQQGDQPGDEETDAVEEAVVAGQRDRSGDAEERGGRQVVAGDRDAVLAAGERGAGGVHVRGALVGLARPDDEHQGDGDERAEDGEVEPGVADLLGLGGGREDDHSEALLFHLVTDRCGARVERPCRRSGRRPRSRRTW